MVDDKKEEEEEIIEVEEKKDDTLKYILILVAGIAIGFIVYKLFKDRKPEYHYMPYNGQMIHDNVEYHDLNVPQYRVPTTQQTIKNPLKDIISSQKPGDATMVVNGIPLNKKGEFVISKHPIKYESVIIKRDLYTGEVLDIIKTDDTMIK